MGFNRPSLRKLEIDELAPAGWLRRQLSIQIGGLTGNLDRFWPDVKDSRWFGGSAEGWERAPYWLDGALPLAYVLGDDELKTRVRGYLDFIIAHQDSDGWLGPTDMNSKLGSNTTKSNYDIWPQFLMLKVLAQYYDILGDEGILQCMRKSLRCIHNHINRYPLFNWAKFRWFEALIPILRCQEIEEEPWLVELAVKLRAQGFNWDGLFEHWPYWNPTRPKEWNYMSHVVNNAMAIKSFALWKRLFPGDGMTSGQERMIDMLDRAHGTAVGAFSGDECLAGKNPSQGTELCAIVEYMYSLEEIIEASGDLSLADRLERIAFNALPAAFTDDMWNHQYDQQVDQLECSVKESWPWTTNGPESNTFGLEPNFGCCTANMHQGWPKFARSLWLKDARENLHAVSYAPCSIRTKIAGKPVELDVKGDYPFGGTASIVVNNEHAATFSLYLRIPKWADKMDLRTDGAAVVRGTDVYEVKVDGKNARIDIDFSMVPRVEPRGRGRSCVLRGPLVFSQSVEPRWVRINPKPELGSYSRGDWELYPLSNWNYAISLEDCGLETTGDLSVPFSSQLPPVTLSVQGREVTNWEAEDGCVKEYPEMPVFSGKAQEVRLVPYGCAKLRVTELPVLASGDRTRGR